MQPEDKHGRQNTRVGGFPGMEDINSGKSRALIWINSSRRAEMTRLPITPGSQCTVLTRPAR